MGKKKKKHHRQRLDRLKANCAGNEILSARISKGCTRMTAEKWKQSGERMSAGHKQISTPTLESDSACVARTGSRPLIN